MKRRKKKSSLNWAVCLMVITTVCLCSIQYGYSFFNQSIEFGGIGSIEYASYSPAEETIADANKNSTNFVSDFTDGTNTKDVAEDLGFSAIFQAEKGASINNYIKFSQNASELWRIVALTDYGIKVVKEESIQADSGVIWDSGNSHWVELSYAEAPTGGVIQTKQTISDLTNASTICQYLNGTYYQNLTSPNNENYVNPNYINQSAYWDITPMIYSNISFPTGMAVGSIQVNGLPIGLLSVVEVNLISILFDVDGYNSAFDGWLARDSGSEMLITEVARDDSITNTDYSTTQAFFLQDGKFNNSNKASSNRHFRPAMYIYNDVILTVADEGQPAGTSTNPFIVTGRGA